MKKFLVCLITVLLMFGCAKKSAYDGNYMYSPEAYNKADDYGGSAITAKNKSENYSSEEKLVYTGSIRLEGKDYDKLIGEINEQITRYKALIQATRETSSGYGSGRTMYLTVRIPAEHFNEFIDELRKGSGSVVDVSTNVDNITQQYNENDIRISALETQHKRLLELLEKAESLADVIKLEERLSEVEIELTQLNNARNQMDAQVRYSTLTMTVSEVVQYSETSFLQRILNAFSGSGSSFVRNLENFIIDLIYALPNLILLAVAFLVLRKPAAALWRRIQEGRKVSLDRKKKDRETDSKESE